MTNKTYIDRLQLLIRRLHGCSSKHVRSVTVHEVFRGQTVWQGDIEVFEVDHPNAQRCYAWSHAEGQAGQGERFVAVLEIPPVNSPESAVRAAIVADVKKSKRDPANPPVHEVSNEGSDRRDEAIKEVKDMRARVARERNDLKDLMQRFRVAMDPNDSRGSNGPASK